MCKVAIINASYPVYNVACEKIANYHRALGDRVYLEWSPMTLQDVVDKFYFSVIFTWDIPELVRRVRMVRDWGKEVEVGGPAATFMPKYIERITGVKPHQSIDQRFEYMDGEYELTFTSRGCPHHCPHCGVDQVEPFFVQYDTFPLAPKVGDNNILATQMSHQRRVVERLATLGKEIDFNSGFDVRFFKEKHYKLYSQLPLVCWRFAFDTMAVEADVRRVAAIMRNHELDRHHVTFYCLIGFPGYTPEECLYRLNTIIELGMNPYPMRFFPMNRPDRTYVAPGWNEDLLQRMSAYYQTPNLWKTDKWENFRPGKGKKKVSPDQAVLL